MNADSLHTCAMKVFESLIFHNILQNETINGHNKNVKFLCADVTSPSMSNNISEGSVDVIFSNWLLMYLSNNEVSFVYYRVSFRNFHDCVLNLGLLGLPFHFFLDASG